MELEQVFAEANAIVEESRQIVQKVSPSAPLDYERIARLSERARQLGRDARKASGNDEKVRQQLSSILEESDLLIEGAKVVEDAIYGRPHDEFFDFFKEGPLG